MLDKRCPHCHKMISIAELKAIGTHQDFIRRRPVNCPHCQQQIVLPDTAEKLMSIGLLFSVIVAPLLYYWLDTQSNNTGIITGIVFAIGIILLVTGIVKNQPQATTEDH